MANSGPGAPASGNSSTAVLVEVGDRAGQRVDNFLIAHLSGVPRSRIYRMIRRGEVRVNGRRVRPTQRLIAGDRVRIPPHFSTAAPETFIGDRQLERVAAAIIHEDERLLVLDKPAGLAVHGGSGVSFGVIEALRRLRPGAELELVHRLDRDTSGCLMVAKRRSELRLLHEALRQGRVEKHYRVIVHGRWPAQRTLVDEPLERYVTAAGERRVRVAADGRPSRTRFALEVAGARASLLQVELETGRTHQIRVHALAAGHPVLGDEKYASPAQLQMAREAGIERLCLHAERLVIHVDGSPRSYCAPLPAAFEAAWEALAEAGGGRSLDGSASSEHR